MCPIFEELNWTGNKRVRSKISAMFEALREKFQILREGGRKWFEVVESELQKMFQIKG